jgi:DNA adenine methylase
MAQTKPFLRWAGSKRKQIPRLRNFWCSSYTRYIEPFAGSACLFFDLQPPEAVLSDKNSELIETYKTVCDHAESVYDAICVLPRDSATYYALRAKNPMSMGRLDRAVRFIYLNRNCFNGIYRTNRNGHFNVPFASSRAGALPDRQQFLTAAQLLRRAKLHSCDFGSTLRHAKSGDFVYLDPPFAVRARRVFREYDSAPFGPSDLQRLGKHLEKLHERGVDFLVSYADCKEAREVASRWRRYRIRVRRHVAGFTSARRVSQELLFTNIAGTVPDDN